MVFITEEERKALIFGAGIVYGCLLVDEASGFGGPEVDSFKKTVEEIRDGINLFTVSDEVFEKAQRLESDYQKYNERKMVRIMSSLGQ